MPSEELERLLHALYLAWTVIANAGHGDWEQESSDWQYAAKRWRDEHYHPILDTYYGAPSNDPAE